jgi:type I restriction enzyme M protein
LPQETFYSSGASVKASILFLQKFTSEENAKFEEEAARAQAEIEAKYAPEIEDKTTGLTAAIEAAKRDGQAEKRKTLQKELKDYLKSTEDRQQTEARQLLKERMDYPIFMYDAEYVGISATGDADYNELYQNDNLPPGLDKTCLEWYRDFQSNSAPLPEKG